MYNIKSYTLQKAKEQGLKVKPSKIKDKKIDVYKNDKKIASIGNINYGDYPTFKDKNGKSYADERRRLYHIRHKNNNNIAGKLAKSLLW